ncbi:MAG: sulfite exporter TauE/SafE family protein [Azospirillaceae bacterium]|nr:sulfite exporter TauE/SafE family protein [Azospirillaceae bacterium]
MDIWTWALLVAAAFAAGVLNAVAGGGSFLGFPALVFAGLPPVTANATNTVALFPGSFASVYAYRREFQPIQGVGMAPMVAVSLVGSVIGALLLMNTPESVFVALVPWLLLLATLVFAFGRRVTALVKDSVHLTPTALLCCQFVIAIYGGYYGGGVGILSMAAMTLFGLRDMHAMNAWKTLLSGSLNAIATVTFVLGGRVVWAPALVMMVAAIIGGYIGADVARKLPGEWVRRFVILTGVAMTAYFFGKLYL